MRGKEAGERDTERLLLTTRPMKRGAPLLLCIPWLLSVACSDDAPAPVAPQTPPPKTTPAPPAPPPPPEPPPVCVESALGASLEKLEGVGDIENVDCGKYVEGAATCFTFTFTQKLDHTNEGNATVFKQRGQLIHRSCSAPTTIMDNGYGLPEVIYEMEPSILFATNTVILEHRFQGESLPPAKDRLWTSLSIENGARDTHAVIASFKKLYPQKWVSTGASKGGITAVYHRFFFPNDVDGTVGYVAPASLARQDTRYQERLDSGVFPAACTTALHAFQTGALGIRRPAFTAALVGKYGLSEADANYSLESSIAHFDWGFWQSGGHCDAIPEANASDQAHVAYFEKYLQSGRAPHTLPATRAEISYAALSYEWAWQQGFALQVGKHLGPDLFQTQVIADSTSAAYFQRIIPGEPLPAFDGSVTERTRDWVKTSAERLVLIYGELDPWSGGALDAPLHPSSGRYYAPGADHGASIQDLSNAEQMGALSKVASMYGKAMAVRGDASQREKMHQRIRDAREALVRHEAVVARMRH